MGNELQVLGWSIVLGLVHVFTAAGFSTQQRGLQWNAGNRDGQAVPLSAAAARAARANRNFLETFPLFAAAVLAVLLLNRATPQTLLGAQIYFWARAVYLPVYIAGIPYLRTLVWAAALWGLVKVLAVLL